MPAKFIAGNMKNDNREGDGAKRRKGTGRSQKQGLEEHCGTATFYKTYASSIKGRSAVVSEKTKGEGGAVHGGEGLLSKFMDNIGPACAGWFLQSELLREGCGEKIESTNWGKKTGASKGR